ncbi:unnamed protein product [Clavelina lepadiformis]|uniref:Sulfotransferase n=1 Tax=Clavelina lepadiformis TaxID=159417 RepID=A0ABP0GTD1_CLALP
MFRRYFKKICFIWTILFVQILIGLVLFLFYKHRGTERIIARSSFSNSLNRTQIPFETSSTVHPFTVSFPEAAQPTVKRKLVLLLAYKRSGSSFLGEMFNNNPAAFYLFEPLFPFTRQCDVLQVERVDALNELFKCNFKVIPSVYRTAFEVTGHTDFWSNCSKNNICFYERHANLLQNYNSISKTPVKCYKRGGCETPLNTTILSNICSRSSLVVYKVLRICDLYTLEAILDNFEKKQDVELKVIHLFRDPRAIIASKLHLKEDETTLENIDQSARRLCQQMLNNINFVNHFWKAKSRRRTSYLPIFFEKMAEEPFATAEKMYDFIGEPLPQSVQSWLNFSVTQVK